MFASTSRCGIGMTFLLMLLSPVRGQEPDFRKFFRKPEKPIEFWNAMKFEIGVGKYDLAAVHLKGFLASKPTDEELLQMEEKEGLSAFLRLRNIPKWVNDPKTEQEIRKDVEELIDRVTVALKALVSDPNRIDKFIKNLSATPEEQAYAIQQLRRSGADAIPPLLSALREFAPDTTEHVAILFALPRLGSNTVPPLLAALDFLEPSLQIELMEVMRQRAARECVPYLWHISASPREPLNVRARATDLLTEFLAQAPDKMPPARAALTREAERYYQHQVTFIDPKAITVWRWDGKQLASQVYQASGAEEYYGLFFARQALDIDPSYTPAQLVFLSLALDKGVERAGLGQPLVNSAPAVNEVVASVNPDLVAAVLERALADKRLPVILGAVRALGDMAEVRAALPRTGQAPPLVRALYYPDRRVQLAAADALLRIPAPPHSQASGRIVEILRRTVAAAIDPVPKALVADFNKQRGQILAQSLKQAGFEVGPDELVQTGREVMQRLGRAADIDVLLIDHALPDPELPYLLGQLRADVNVGQLPLLVLIAPDENGRIAPDLDLKIRRLVEPYRYAWVVPAPRNPDFLKETLAQRIRESQGEPITEAERKNNAAEALVWLDRLAHADPAGYDIRPAQRAILMATRSDELGPIAVDAAGRLAGSEPQQELASVVLNNARDVRLRTLAAFELYRHIQQNGLTLSKAQQKAMIDLFVMGLRNEPELKLRANVALVLGTMRPDPRVTGLRLQDYSPPPPAPAKEAPPKEEKKEPEKKEVEKKEPEKKEDK